MLHTGLDFVLFKFVVEPKLSNVQKPDAVGGGAKETITNQAPPQIGNNPAQPAGGPPVGQPIGGGGNDLQGHERV